MPLDQFYILMQVIFWLLLPGAILLIINQALELRSKFKKWQFRRLGGRNNEG